MNEYEWLWMMIRYIIDDGTIFKRWRHSMDLGLGYASLQFHHPGCEWSSSSAKDSYQRSLCKGEGQGFESMSKTVGVFQYHFGDPFWGACLKRGLCMVCVKFYWVVVSCLHKNAWVPGTPVVSFGPKTGKDWEEINTHWKWGVFGDQRQ